MQKQNKFMQKMAPVLTFFSSSSLYVDESVDSELSDFSSCAR